MEPILNGKTVTVDVESTMPLLWVLRDELGMTGTKYGCGVSSCGACTVLLDGVATRSCPLPVSAAAGKSITTIEGITRDGQLSAVQRAWIEQQVCIQLSDAASAKEYRLPRFIPTSETWLMDR